jgi:hypothetical protein
MFKKNLGRLILVAAAVCAVGCSNKPSFPSQGVSNDVVELSHPTVWIEGDSISISGSVKRRPGVTGTIDGRVDITILGPGGGSLVWVPALLTPNPIPYEGLGESQYIVHYGYIPPAGSTVVAHFVDADTAKEEDVDNTEKDATKGLRGSNGEFGDTSIIPKIGLHVQ